MSTRSVQNTWFRDGARGTRLVQRFLDAYRDIFAAGDIADSDAAVARIAVSVSAVDMARARSREPRFRIALIHVECRVLLEAALRHRGGATVPGSSPDAGLPVGDLLLTLLRFRLTLSATERFAFNRFLEAAPMLFVREDFGTDDATTRRLAMLRRRGLEHLEVAGLASEASEPGEEGADIFFRYRRSLASDTTLPDTAVLAAFLHLNDLLCDAERRWVERAIARDEALSARYDVVVDEAFALDDATVTIVLPIAPEMAVPRRARYLDGDLILEIGVQDTGITGRIIRIPPALEGDHIRIVLPEGAGVMRLPNARRGQRATAASADLDLTTVERLSIQVANRSAGTEEHARALRPSWRAYALALLVSLGGLTLGVWQWRNAPLPGTVPAGARADTSAFAVHPVLERDMKRVRRTGQGLTLLFPEIGDTLKGPVTFRWTGIPAGGETLLEVVDNHARVVWATRVSDTVAVLSDSLAPGRYYWKARAPRQVPSVGMFLVER